MAHSPEASHHRQKAANKYSAKQASRKIAEQCAAQRRAERRRNVWVATGSTLATLAVVAVIVIIGIAHHSSSPTNGANPVAKAPSEVTASLAASARSTLTTPFPPDFTLVKGRPAAISGSSLLDSNGKPELLYIGAEYCPYCAATRWPLAVALSRFGSFSGLKTTYSSNSDQVGPHTPTLSFHGATYSSPYVAFDAKEQEDGAQRPLDSLTAEENSLFNKYGVAPGGSGPGYPFIDFFGKVVQQGASYDPSLLKGMTPTEVAQSIATSSSKAAQTIRASADYFTALICQADGQQPSSVCRAANVTAATSVLPK